jgi:hypothetical protein
MTGISIENKECMLTCKSCCIEGVCKVDDISKCLLYPSTDFK